MAHTANQHDRHSSTVNGSNAVSNGRNGDSGHAHPSVGATTTQRPCYIYYGTRSVKARIDLDVPLEEIIRQLAASSQLQIAEPAALFALREKDSGELVTEHNLPQFLERNVNFKLGSSPTIEAAEMVEKLKSNEARKMGLFSLKTLIKEEGFLSEFLIRGGYQALQQVIHNSSGNTLAYALLSMQGLIELEQRGWAGLDPVFVSRLVEIIATEPLINVCRPATAILSRLSLANPEPDEPSSPASGFAIIYNEIGRRQDFLKTVVQRLLTGDVAGRDVSLALINSLFQGTIELGDPRFGDELEELDAWRAITKLLETSKDGDASLLYAFQGNLMMFLHQSLITPVDEEHYAYFDELWAAGGLQDDDPDHRWSRLGFRTESPQLEFDKTGVLGLKALVRFAEESQNEFATTVKETLERPSDHRCPLATASNLVTRELAEFFDLTSGIPRVPTTPMPFLLRFYECHTLALQFFFRIWLEAGATATDFQRLAAITQMHIRNVLQDTGKSWFAVRKEFLSTDFRTARDAHVERLAAIEETKPAVKQLRHKLYLEAYDFVRNQRVKCMQQGAWFTTSGKKYNSLRFYRLAPDRKVLHWVEASERRVIRPGLDELPDKIELSGITDVVPGHTGSSSAARGRTFSLAALNPRHSTDSPLPAHSSTTTTVHPSQVPASSQSKEVDQTTLSFSLHTSSGTLVELHAQDRATFAEWLDGLLLLRPDALIQTKETADLVQMLTDFGVTTRLLQASGDSHEGTANLNGASVDS